MRFYDVDPGTYPVAESYPSAQTSKLSHPRHIFAGGDAVQTCFRIHKRDADPQSRGRDRKLHSEFRTISYVICL